MILNYQIVFQIIYHIYIFMLINIVILLLLGSFHTQLTLPIQLYNPTISQTFLHLRRSRQSYNLHSRNSFFTLDITINGYIYNLVVDSGSSDFWIKGENISGLPKQRIKCSQCMRHNQKLQLLYLDGQLNTYVYNANIELGKHHFNEFILVAYEKQTSNFEKIQGIIGLSYPYKSANKNHPNFLTTLINNNIIDQYSFGIKFNFHQRDKSFITFGNYDPRFIANGSRIIYYNFTKSKKYQIQINGIELGDTYLPIQLAFLDTGNTCISFPDIYTKQILKEFNKKNNKCKFIRQRGSYQFKSFLCIIKDFQQLPQLDIIIGSDHYLISKQYYLRKCVKSKYKIYYACTTFIQNVSNRQDIFLGAGFIQAHYLYFDLSNKRIGIARNNDIKTMDDLFNKR